METTTSESSQRDVQWTEKIATEGGEWTVKVYKSNSDADSFVIDGERKIVYVPHINYLHLAVGMHMALCVLFAASPQDVADMTDPVEVLEWADSQSEIYEVVAQLMEGWVNRKALVLEIIDIDSIRKRAETSVVVPATSSQSAQVDKTRLDTDDRA